MLCDFYTQPAHQAVVFFSCSRTCDPLRWLCRPGRQCGAARSGLRKVAHPSHKLVFGASCSGVDRHTPPHRD